MHRFGHLKRSDKFILNISALSKDLLPKELLTVFDCILNLLTYFSTFFFKSKQKKIHIYSFFSLQDKKKSFSFIFFTSLALIPLHRYYMPT